MSKADPVASVLDSIAAEFDVAMGRPEKVRVDCARLREHLARSPGAVDVERLCRLAPLLRQRMGPIAEPLFDFLEQQAAASDDPWPLVEGLLRSREPALVRKALGTAEELAGRGSLRVDRRALQFMAEAVEEPGSPLGEAAALAAIARLVRQDGSASPDPVLGLYVEPAASPRMRGLAARLLDLPGEPAPLGLAERLLGGEAYAFLAPYLRYTRATHGDLLHLQPDPGRPPPALASLRQAEEACGEALLREVIAGLGWARVNLGLEVQPRVAVSLGGSVPLVVSPAEAPVLETSEGARRTAELWIVVAHGGLPGAGGESGADSVVGRFRAYNLAHAEALAEILDVKALTREKVERLLALMDRIVSDFGAIFAPHAEECAILPGLYRDLRARVVAELEREGAPAQLSAELTRLVQSFEDPRTLGEVRTIHGLKRYLHQRGLRLGFRLVETGGGTNRTVDLVLASGTRVLQCVRKIAYVDFEGEEALLVPHAVALIADGFARQLLLGQEAFPSAQVFCYGNEVHYYLAFRNHPAFLRIDYSPPLLGGMIDLEYYGVSVYEQSAHPNPALDALRLFFRRLEFYVQIDGTRVHARYDKERALDLGDICDKAELLCGFVPYLMDLDWTIGSLSLDAPARQRVAEAWSESFAEWGVLPVGQLLTRDRQGILLGVETGPEGEREVAWSGEPPYRDRFRVPAPPGLLERLQALPVDLGLEAAPIVTAEAGPLVGQLRLERQLLRPLREAVARGQLVATAEGLRRCPPDRFESRHEAEAFAGLLAAGDVAPAARLARLVAPLERTLRFRATGRVNGHELQRARLPLRGETLGLYVLRDASGIIRLALFTRGDVLGRRRRDGSAPWEATWSADSGEILALLRRDNYLPPGGEPGEVRPGEAAEILAWFRQPRTVEGPPPLPGERVLRGFRASPGRAVGRAQFGTEGRVPEDLDAAVLVAPSVRPEDNTFLYHARGIVSTGGGILSHAGLIATQFRKPALIVSGQWQRELDGSSALLYRTPEYREEHREVEGGEVVLFRDWREREHRLREGDLVALDAVAGTLRVLGQERDALALDEELWRLGEAGRRLARAVDPPEVLAFRGHRVRAAHQIRRILVRLTDPVLARHAAHELLSGEALAGEAASRDDRVELLSLLLRNTAVGEAAREYLVALVQELRARHVALVDEARRSLPTAASVHEVLARRLEARRLGEAVEDSATSLRACGVEWSRPPVSGAPDIEGLALARLRELRAARRRDLAAAPAPNPRRRHLLREVERLDLLLGCSGEADVRPARARLAEEDEAARHALHDRLVVTAGEAGFELHPLIGWKAANLAEVTRLGGGLVPPWFVVTDRAFVEVLDAPLARSGPGAEAAAAGASTLREAVAAVLERGKLDNARKSALIRGLWDGAPLPEALSREVSAAYRRLAEAPGWGAEPDGPEGPFVAIRSSAREEDAEIAARAGEFETFLFVRGEGRLLEHLRRAWSGLWTERAIHNRALPGTGSERAGGGVIFQRIVRSRVSGVLQTVNVAEGNPREMVVNAGLGLGEGIVTGTVAADHVVVAKEGDLERGPLRFRYVTADKRERVVFDRRSGLGTSRAECLYHQRLRPALEYVELAELVAVAARLEAAYGYPLDVEFGIEGSQLFVLQVRPVATFASLLQETLERHPLEGP
ncbi:MAG TPA: PEP/pyruvate-binding domain-containing protein [Vicinamibacteria bacterium]|nr:PEP/pyruvate-binding domain-containing protein [Vicinamibacteria bacterium]